MEGLRQAESPELYDRRWEEVVNATCCGDIVLAEAFEEAGVRLTQAGPMVRIFWWCSFGVMEVELTNFM